MVREVFHYLNITRKACHHLDDQVLDFFDFTFILDGQMVYYANGKKYTVKKNDAIFLRPGTLRSRNAGTEPVRYVSFNFYASDSANFPFPDYMPGCITANIRNLIAAHPYKHLSTFYHAKEKCASILNYIIYELLDSSTVRCNNEHVARMINYIDENILEKLSLTSISNHVGLTKEYTCNIFKRETGKTLIDYINERKILLAKELILNNEMSLTEVSEYLGFDNYNYFSRLFKKYLQSSPMALKRK